MVTRYPWRPIDKNLTVYGDSNHAGCLRTRQSTVGGVAVWGGQFLKSWSKTISILCLSSGESELAAVVKATAEGIGLGSVLMDFGFESRLTVRSDATAAIGMVKRQGLGKVRHLAVADLWVQQRVRLGHVHLAKHPGTENPADALTKVLSREHNRYLLEKVGCYFIEGRAASTPTRVK